MCYISTMTSIIKKIAISIGIAGGECFYVGGCVRDKILNLPEKDVDIEVFRLRPQVLKDILSIFGKVDEVGASFSVLKLTVENKVFDFSLPRNEKKIGTGHRGFEIEASPFMSYKDAAKRRDITINALMENVLTGDILDFYSGIEDLKNKTIRHVSRETFVEDSLRVLRVCQFAARFEFTLAEETLELCQTIDLSDLPAERIKEELFKLLLKGTKPSIGVKLMHETGVVKQLFPEFTDVQTTELINRAVRLRDDCFSFDSEEEKLIFTLAVFLVPVGLENAEKILDRLKIYTQNGTNIRQQMLLQLEHFNKPLYMYNAEKSVYNRLAQTGLNLSVAERIVAIDQPWVAAQFFNKCQEYDMPMDGSKIQPILKGQHLVDLGYTPGVEMGKLLKQAFELQVDNKISSLEEALAAIGVK